MAESSVALDNDPETGVKKNVNTRNILGRSSVLSKHSGRTESVLDQITKAPLPKESEEQPHTSYVKYIDHKSQP